jgi:hypothetical protein
MTIKELGRSATARNDALRGAEKAVLQRRESAEVEQHGYGAI